MNSSNGLLFAGDLLVAVRNPSTGVFGAYERLQADKFEITTPSDMLQKVSKGRETFGHSWLTHFVGKPAEFALTLDEVSRSVLSMRLSGESTEVTQTAGALTGIEITVVPGRWVEIGVENLDLATLEVTNPAGTTTYVKDVDYQVNPRTGMIYVPVAADIPAGPVKFTAGRKAYAGLVIEGGKQFSTTMRLKLDGINLITREDILLIAPQVTVNAQDAFDFLSGELASVPLKGLLEIADGYTSPFQLKYFSAG